MYCISATPQYANTVGSRTERHERRLFLDPNHPLYPCRVRFEQPHPHGTVNIQTGLSTTQPQQNKTTSKGLRRAATDAAAGLRGNTLQITSTTHLQIVPRATPRYCVVSLPGNRHPEKFSSTIVYHTYPHTQTKKGRRGFFLLERQLGEERKDQARFIAEETDVPCASFISFGLQSDRSMDR